MNVFAIGDLHLSGNPPTHPMNVFGAHWDQHWDKIKKDWLAKVGPEDIVLLLGDTSWALKLNQALEDLEAIAQLPGHKFIIRGNHDYWWSSATKMTKATKGHFHFIQGHGDLILDGTRSIALGGSRAYLCPNDTAFKEDTDRSIYERELMRVEAALQEMDSLLAKAKEDHPEIQEEIRLLLLHYPPFNDENQASGFTDLMAKYKVDHCVFGHLHDQNSFDRIPHYFGSTQLHLVSADYLNFTIKELL